jgi:sialate O-acetylesterase
MRFSKRNHAPRALLLAAAGAIGLLVLGTVSASADVKLPAVLSDHMVLQQQMSVPVWGTADAGEEVTVTFGQQKQTAKAGPDGKWAVKLSPLQASDKPAELTVAGKNTLKLSDILVGEVWICSGQSNMEFRVSSAKNAKEEIAEAKYPEIRLFSVHKRVSEEPLSDVWTQGAQKWENRWEECSPESVGNFSAVGYFFGRDLHKAIGVPVGLIHTSWGGTPAEAWASPKALESDSDFKPILERSSPDEAAYQKKVEAWEKAAEKAKADGRNVPRKPTDPKNDPNGASVLYNGMITPIVPFACRGATWYQGESNAGRAYQYRKLLPAMIQSWREAWGEPDLAFLIVQLANFQAPPTEPPANDDWAELREAQWLTAQQPHNGIALAIDLADADKPEDIHPKDKQDVGGRLALVAEAKVYGKDVAYSGPVYDSMKVEGGKVRLHFKSADGMEAKGGELKGFQIAGGDRQWHWADARIDGDSVVVSSDKVPLPVAVRYDWAHNPQGNLYNKAGLPAVPFRTDDWPGVTVGKN